MLVGPYYQRDKFNWRELPQDCGPLEIRHFLDTHGAKYRLKHQIIMAFSNEYLVMVDGVLQQSPLLI